MGRYEKSKGLAPPAVRKDIRAKQARHIINKVVPAILASSAKARKGSQSSELIVDPLVKVPGSAQRSQEPGKVDVKRNGHGKRKAKNESGHHASTNRILNEKNGEDRKGDTGSSAFAEQQPLPETASSLQQQVPEVRIVASDTLTAATLIQDTIDSKTARNVCILNMASPLRPGGGVLAGATSQEEFLCARTTLLPSLKEEYYRLPEYGGIWTPDVQVFRNSLPLDDPDGELAHNKRYWVDVISSGMLRFPELEGNEDEAKTLSRNDRDVVEKKMRAVLAIATQKRVKKIVLGAWGCGAYGNPVHDVALAWRNALGVPKTQARNSYKGKEHVPAWYGLEEIVFSISNLKMARAFAHAFDRHIEIEMHKDNISEEQDDGEEAKEDSIVVELRTKIEDMEAQISHVWNVDLKTRMEAILDGLRAQLRDRQGQREPSADHEGEETVEDDTEDKVEESSSDG